MDEIIKTSSSSSINSLLIFLRLLLKHQTIYFWAFLLVLKVDKLTLETAFMYMLHPHQIKQWEQLLDPQLNPFVYENITAEEAVIGWLATLGVVTLPKPPSPFEVGIDLASTEGEVIFENQVCQLIRFGARSTIVHRIPLLIVPPWINKYYIFDLSKEKSIIRWLVNCGIDVYCISWINADRSHFNIPLDDFIEHGILRAAAFIMEMKNIPHVHSFGYCIGGVGLAMGAFFEKKMFKSLTFAATPFDFKAMDLVNEYVNETMFSYIHSLLQQEGVLHGERLHFMFSQMKANEMIYQDIIDRVYLKKEKQMIDYLHWNSDVSNIPGRVHLDYLKRVYFKNNLLEKIEEIQLPTFVMSAEKDHIVPPKASFPIWNYLDTLTFCLAQGGHVAGVVHNPNRTKYTHKIIKKNNNKDASVLKEQIYYAGDMSQVMPSIASFNYSWWHSFYEWLSPMLGPKENIAQYNIPFIEKAPGRYVKAKA